MKNKSKSKNKTKTNKNKGGKAFSKSAPIVSVVIPAYHAAAYLEQAALSVVNQTYEGEWELLIVDDASDDRTGEVGQALEKKDPRIRYIRQPSNQGVAAARNRGVKEAKGAYVAFLDADDWWEAGKLEAQMALLEKTGMALCCTGRELMAPDGAPVGRVISVPERITYKMLLKTNLIPLGSVVMKKEAAAEFGFTHDKYHEDYILWLNVLRKYGDACGIAHPFLKCRLSAGGKSRNKLKSAWMHYRSCRCAGIGRIKSMYCMVFYAINGVLKYYG